MVIRGRAAVLSIVVGSLLFGGVVFSVVDVLPGLSVESLAGLLPSWAVSAQVSHTVLTLGAKTKTSDVSVIVSTLDRFAASHGFTRDEDGAVMVKAADPDHLRLSYTGKLASLSFYTEPGAAVLAVESEPGRDDDLSALAGDVRTMFGPLGFAGINRP